MNQKFICANSVYGCTITKLQIKKTKTHPRVLKGLELVAEPMKEGD